MAKIKWKTKQEIEEEKNRPKEPTETEILIDYIIEVDFRVVLLELGLI